MILQMLRDLLIDYALDHRDRELFMRLTSADWEQFVVQPVESVDQAPVLVMHDRDTKTVVKLQLPDCPQPTVFAVPEDEWDSNGWRDPYGLTFYDRLRSAGFRFKSEWRAVDAGDWQAIQRSCRIVHPMDLAIAHPSKTLRVQSSQRRFTSNTP
ncbi:MAG: IDEAL domain-containing protein [Alicyclobacillus macrosporangiidus]|jgi:hypothetical protein|nr:IDEAL domain-containing protein [Alicyclobacillus macrosporangiidus]MCL6600266.1 IDEAL domain-containing protein [Alicyclobacillus macrosporangiidus]